MGVAGLNPAVLCAQEPTLSLSVWSEMPNTGCDNLLPNPGYYPKILHRTDT